MQLEMSLPVMSPEKWQAHTSLQYQNVIRHANKAAKELYRVTQAMDYINIFFKGSKIFAFMLQMILRGPQKHTHVKYCVDTATVDTAFLLDTCQAYRPPTAGRQLTGCTGRLLPSRLPSDLGIYSSYLGFAVLEFIRNITTSVEVVSSCC